MCLAKRYCIIAYLVAGLSACSNPDEEANKKLIELSARYQEATAADDNREKLASLESIQNEFLNIPVETPEASASLSIVADKEVAGLSRGLLSKQIELLRAAIEEREQYLAQVKEAFAYIAPALVVASDLSKRPSVSKTANSEQLVLEYMNNIGRQDRLDFADCVIKNSSHLKSEYSLGLSSMVRFFRHANLMNQIEEAGFFAQLFNEGFQQELRKEARAGNNPHTKDFEDFLKSTFSEEEKFVSEIPENCRLELLELVQ